jgi:hypothetical protein
VDPQTFHDKLFCLVKFFGFWYVTILEISLIGLEPVRYFTAYSDRKRVACGNVAGELLR